MALYDIMPEILLPYASIIMPFIELSLGVLLLAGFHIKPAAVLSILLMLFFIIIISINIYRSKTFDCGCFELSRFGINEEIGFSVIIRDAIFIILLIFVMRGRKHLLSIDNMIEKRRLDRI